MKIGLRLDCDGSPAAKHTGVVTGLPSLTAYMNGMTVATLPIPPSAVDSGLCWMVELRSREGAGQDRTRGSVQIEGLPSPELVHSDG